MSARTLLVTGASGHLGHHIVELLLARGGNDHIVAATRNPDSLRDLEAKGVELRSLDLESSVEEIARVFAGVDRLLLVSTNALDRPGHRAEQHLRAVAAAKLAGVKHILYTSTVNAQDPLVLLAEDHRITEEAMAASGLGYTVLRDNWYAENVEGDFRYALQSGTLSLATGEGRVGFVTRFDCARAAAAALAADFDGARTLDITGPAVLSLSDLAGILSRLGGKTVVASPVTRAQRQAGLKAVGLPEGVANMLAECEEAMARGWLESASGVVEELTGKRPQSVEEWLRELLG